MSEKRRTWVHKFAITGSNSTTPKPAGAAAGAASRAAASASRAAASASRAAASASRATSSLDLPRSPTSPQDDNKESASKPSFSRSLSNMMNALSRTHEDGESRGRTLVQLTRVSSSDPNSSERSRSRARSVSPFTLAFRRRRTEPSPPPSAVHLSYSDAESDADTSSIRLRSTAYDSGDDTATDDDDSSDDGFFDDVTERNTEHNALIVPPVPLAQAAAEEADPDPLGEGVNVVVPPEPYFPSTLNTSSRMKRNPGPRRRKSTRHHEPLSYETSRPVFQRDRCTITITQGDPAAKLASRKKRRYIVASDLSEESRYAVEWAIGTVLRDGDSLLIVTVNENDAKVDPLTPNASDRTTKLRSQQERQGLAYILVRQATSLLQRTKLNVKVACQAWHAKNARHMLLDIVDYNEPEMVIVGSRGLGQLKGILLGSTSHYLIQKCSVPVMVARRRLKRPPRRSAHLSTHRTHVSLAEAGIDRVVHKVDEDVQVMREEIQRDDERKGKGKGKGLGVGAAAEGVEEEEEGEEGDEEEGEDEGEGENEGEEGVKVQGSS